MHMARNGISDFDGYVQKYSPLLRNMKTVRLESLLEVEQYNIGDEDTAKHWLTPLTGIACTTVFLKKYFFLKYIDQWCLVGFYSYYLNRFLERFSRKQFLVLSGDELRVDPFRVMTKIQESFNICYLLHLR